jgi:hypothetical protein
MQGGDDNLSREELNFYKPEYKFINNEFEANKILSQILKDKGCVLGIDIEAAVEMSRFGILCLLQVFS